MKTTTINLRVDPTTKDQLEILSERKNVTVSNIIRDAVHHFLESEITLKHELAKTKNGIQLVKTIGFTEFVFWLYHKTIDSEISEIKELYIQFIELINECKNYPLFNPDLIVEFEKVSSELNRVVFDENYKEYYFHFPQFNENSFDYQVLADFMYTLRYDSENNEVIHCK